MTNSLMDIPGMGGWLQADQLRAAGQTQGLENQVKQMSLAEMMRGRQEDMQLQQIMGQTQGDYSKAIPALVQAGTPKSLALAAKLDDALKSKQPKYSIGEIYDNKTGRKQKVMINDNDPTDIRPIGGVAAAGADGSGGNPYSTPVYDEKGRLVSFNNRSGTLSIPQSPFLPKSEVPVPIVGAKHSPSLQRDITAAEGEGKAIGEQRGLLPNQKNALTSVDNAIGLLDKGIYTGAYAQLKKAGAKYTPLVNTEKASNTETFLSEIGNTIVPRLKEFGGNDSNEELKYLRAISAGDITLEESAIRAILASTKMKIERGIKRIQSGMDANGNPAQPTQPTQQKRLRFDAQGNQIP